jgi:hypothetical protein
LTTSMQPWAMRLAQPGSQDQKAIIGIAADNQSVYR